MGTQRLGQEVLACDRQRPAQDRSTRGKLELLKTARARSMCMYININHLAEKASSLAPTLTGILLPSSRNQAVCLPRCVNVLTPQGHSVDLPSL